MATSWRGRIASLMAVGLVGTRPGTVVADPKGYVYTAIRFLGDPLPAGGSFVNDFEPDGLNNHGDMAFGADAPSA